MNTALVQVRSNSMNRPYLVCEKHVNLSILIYSTFMTQQTNGPILKYACIVVPSTQNTFHDTPGSAVVYQPV